jgi:uncharacterized protein YbgA (DUF1722 family)
VQELWAQHKYSVMARDPALYQAIGRRVARVRRGADIGGLALELTAILRQRPALGRLATAVEHMWGYVSDAAATEARRLAQQSTAAMLLATQRLAIDLREPFLLSSTALSELTLWPT